LLQFSNWNLRIETEESKLKNQNWQNAQSGEMDKPQNISQIAV